MTPQNAGEQLRMSGTEFEAPLARAAKTGTRRALQEVGPDGKDCPRPAFVAGGLARARLNAMAQA
jgi:hypothetical protein